MDHGLAPLYLSNLLPPHVEDVSSYRLRNAQVTHSRIGRRISHGYDPASFVAIRIGP